jgi:hypothetical protein
MNRMRTTGSRNISDTCDSDAYASECTAAVGGTSTLGEKAVNIGRCARRRPHTRPLGFPGSLRNSLEPPNRGLDTSTNRCCPEFRDHVNFDARAEWHLRHTDGTAGMDAPLAEHLDK